MTRSPIPVLRPFVALVWASDSPVAGMYAQPVREHVLPTGSMHLVFRLTDYPLRILGPDASARPQPVGSSMIGGVRSRFYVRELAAPSCSVGAVLRPGAAALLFGVSADHLAERHTPLEDVWGASADRLREQLLEARTAEEKLAILEAALAARLPHVHSLHPAIAAVLDQMDALPSIEAAVRRSGISHRLFVAHFRRTLGFEPKVYVRVLRFQRALRHLRRSAVPSLAALAAEAGYSDQAHFNRDFKEFAGVTPMAYLRRSPREANHLPL
jgi:AraC-like DNA-binding protein